MFNQKIKLNKNRESSMTDTSQMFILCLPEWQLAARLVGLSQVSSMKRIKGYSVC